MMRRVDGRLSRQNLKILDLASCNAERGQDPCGFLLRVLDHD